MDRPDEGTWQWVEQHLGRSDIVHHFAHDHGYSRLWRIQSNRQFFWLKMHNFPVKWAGEVHALNKWTPSLGKAPSLIAYCNEPCAVLMSEVEGVPAEDLSLSPAQEKRLWNEAGEWLRRLHEKTNNWLGTINPDGSPSGKPTDDPVEFVQEIFDLRIREGIDMQLFDKVEIDFIEQRVAEWLPSLSGEPAHAIHRDFTPRNWMATAQGELTAVIDFEHARWDVRAADMNRWWDGDFVRHPELKEAFFESYGEPDERLVAQMRIMRLCNATTGVVWATKVKDLPFTKVNREALYRMMNQR